MQLVRDNVTTLYEQIAAGLRHDISAGRYGPSGKLPSEAALVSRFKVSRVTVRLALGRLEDEGVIERRQGKGSYVSGKLLRHPLNSLLSFQDALRAQGMSARAQALSHELTRLPDPFSPLLGASSRQCMLVRRLHWADEQPVAVATSYLPEMLADVHWDQAQSRPLYALLEERLGIQAMRADISILAAAAEKDVARWLGLKPGAPVLVMRRSTFVSDGHCCEHSVFYIQPQRYEFCLSSSTEVRLGAVAPG